MVVVENACEATIIADRRMGILIIIAVFVLIVGCGVVR
jgi:hypothetical protein